MENKKRVPLLACPAVVPSALPLENRQQLVGHRKCQHAQCRRIALSVTRFAVVGVRAPRAVAALTGQELLDGDRVIGSPILAAQLVHGLAGIECAVVVAVLSSQLDVISLEGILD